jgi:hypothetical protein
MKDFTPRVVNYRVERGSGNTYRQFSTRAIVVDADAKRFKLIIQDTPMVVRWVPRVEGALMVDLMVGQDIVFDHNSKGKVTGQRLVGGTPYPVEKAKRLFRQQWKQRNEGQVPQELKA